MVAGTEPMGPGTASVLVRVALPMLTGTHQAHLGPHGVHRTLLVTAPQWKRSVAGRI